MTSIDELIGAAKASVDDGTNPACQIAVGYRDEIVAFETFGAAENTTRFCIFSATKPIVASAIWLLIADGKLDVARPVAHYLDEFANDELRSVTVEQVLLHTAGFPNALMSETDGGDPAQRSTQLARWRLEWEPGTRFEYHGTSAHWVLATLIDRLAGSDFRDVVEQRVCAPLGLPRVLGLDLDAQTNLAPLVAMDAAAANDFGLHWNDPQVRAAGVPGAGAFMTAAELARFYQALVHNPNGTWDASVLRDATANIRCTFDDPLMGVAVNRTIGLVVAGDDGNHIFRYAIFGDDNTPSAFGHAGAHGQVGWADPETGISFAYVTNAITSDMFQAGVRSHGLSSIAAALSL